MKILHRAQHRARIPVPSPYCNVVQESVRQLSWVSRLLLCWGWLESWESSNWLNRKRLVTKNKQQKNSAKTPHVRIFNFVSNGRQIISMKIWRKNQHDLHFSGEWILYSICLVCCSVLASFFGCILVCSFRWILIGLQLFTFKNISLLVKLICKYQSKLCIVFEVAF